MDQLSPYIYGVLIGNIDVRNDSDVGIHWVRTLCNACHEERIKKAIETREKRKNMSPADILNEIKNNMEEKKGENENADKCLLKKEQ